MNFLKFALSLICFGYLFWHVLMLVIFLPTMAVAPLLVWSTEGERTSAKRFLFLPLLLLSFFFGTFLPAAFYSGGVYAITSHFVQHASHAWIYIGIGGLLCFWFAAPSGETSILAILTSLGCYILFMTVLGPVGQRIGDLGDTVINWTIGIMLVLLVIGLLGALAFWLFKKATTTPPPLPLGDTDNTSGYGKGAVLPATLKGWNWGAFFLTWLWGLGNGAYIGLLYFIPVPIVQLILPFVMGAKGNRWAWANKRWQDETHFKRVQRRWTVGGLVFFVLMIVYIVVRVRSGDWDREDWEAEQSPAAYFSEAADDLTENAEE